MLELIMRINLLKSFLIEKKNTSKGECQIVKQLLNEHSHPAYTGSDKVKEKWKDLFVDQVRYTFYFLFLKKNVYVNMTKASFSGSKNQ